MQINHKIKTAREILFTVILITALSSCTSYSFVSVKIPKNAPVKIDENIKSILIMSRAANRKFERYSADELQLTFYKNRFIHSVTLKDSTAVESAIQSASDNIYGSHKFDVVVPVDWHIYGLPTENRAAQTPLSNEYVTNICKLYSTDALLVLEQFESNVKTNYSATLAIDVNTGKFASNQLREADIDVAYFSKWRLYSPYSDKLNLVSDDTICWSVSKVTSQTEIFKNIPSIAEASRQSGLAAGEGISNIIAPTWHKTTRKVYETSSTTGTGRAFADRESIKRAIEQWESDYKTASKSNLWKISFNIGVAYEVYGNIAEAKRWIEISDKHKSQPTTVEYLKQLNSLDNLL